MGNTSSQCLEIGEMTTEESKRAQRRFQRLTHDGQKVALSVLNDLPELSGNAFVPRIFEVFDGDGDGYISADEFAAAMRAIAGMAVKTRKEEFLFRLYDADNDGLISESDLQTTLSTFSGQALSTRQLQAIVAATIASHDHDEDGHLSLPEFQSMLESGGAAL